MRRATTIPFITLYISCIGVIYRGLEPEYLHERSSSISRLVITLSKTPERRFLRRKRFISAYSMEIAVQDMVAPLVLCLVEADDGEAWTEKQSRGEQGSRGEARHNQLSCRNFLLEVTPPVT